MQSNNLYVYALNNPGLFIDLNGSSVVLACILIGAVAGAIIGGLEGGPSAPLLQALANAEIKVIFH